MPVYRDDGKQLVVLSVKVPLLNSNSAKAYGVFGVAIDITDQKEALKFAQYNQQALIGVVKQEASQPLNNILSLAIRLLKAKRINKDQRIHLAQAVIQEGSGLRDGLADLLSSTNLSSLENAISLKMFAEKIYQKFGSKVQLKMPEDCEKGLSLSLNGLEAVMAQINEHRDQCPSDSVLEIDLSFGEVPPAM